MQFEPHIPEKEYKVILSGKETLLIQKIRSVSFGSLKIHMAGGNIVRTETITGELTENWNDEEISIALDNKGK